MRSVPEWIGKHDDQPVPAHVQARIFETHHGVCHVSGRKIRPGEKWEVEHIIALCNGGEHRESNLAPALVQPHREKTARDRKIKAKNDRVRCKHLGIRGKSKFATSKDGPYKQKLDGTIVRR